MDNLQSDKLFMASFGVVCAVSVWHTVEGHQRQPGDDVGALRTGLEHDAYGSLRLGEVCGRNNVVSFHNKPGSTDRTSRRGQVVSDGPLL